jgi:hypothetical protein
MTAPSTKQRALNWQGDCKRPGATMHLNDRLMLVAILFFQLLIFSLLLFR